MTFYRAALLIGIAGGVGILIWFDVSGEGWRSWLRPQPILSVVTLIVGFAMLSWQLRRQHESTLDANRRQSQDRLKLEIYNEIARRLEAASPPIMEAAMTPMAVVGELGIRLQYSMPSSHQPASLHSLSVNSERAMASLMVVLETYEIVMPEFTIFRKELADASRRLRTALGDFIPLAIPFVVADSARVSLHWPPTNDDMDEMSRLANIANDAGFDVSAVLYDLRVEAQNYLLGELVGRRLPKRAPTDPSIKVTSITQKAP